MRDPIRDPFSLCIYEVSMKDCLGCNRLELVRHRCPLDCKYAVLNKTITKVDSYRHTSNASNTNNVSNTKKIYRQTTID